MPAQRAVTGRTAPGPRLARRLPVDGSDRQSRPDHQQILDLQRQAGNRAVTQVLQRVPDPVPERKRTGQGNQINMWLGAISEVRRERINAWEKTAHSREPNPTAELLAAIISVASLGLGGVVYGVMEKMISKTANHLVKEFVLLAGLETGDIVAEKVLHEALKENRDDLEKGVRNASGTSRQSSVAALAGSGDIIDVYAEALRLQTIQEFTEESTAFNTSSASLSDQRIANKSAALKLTYDQLMADPTSYMSELTVGFIQLLDEVNVADEAADYGGDREKARNQDPDLNETSMRQGNLMVFPWPRNHSLGSWASPDFAFSGFNAAGIGLNDPTMERLRGTTVDDLKVSMGFRFRAANPFYRLWKGDMGTTDVWFTRQPNGAVHVASDADEDGVEWLASYFAGSGRDFSDSERSTYSLLGAQKLYNAIAGRTLTQINQDP